MSTNSNEQPTGKKTKPWVDSDGFEEIVPGDWWDQAVAGGIKLRKVDPAPQPGQDGEPR